MNNATVAIVQDHIVQRGGGERVLLSMCKALPEATVHTAFYWAEASYPEVEALPIEPMPIDRVPGLRRRHRMTLPILPFAYDRLHVDADVVVCGSSGWAAGARTTGRKIVYFHALARWLHDPDAYMGGRGRIERVALAGLAPWLRRWDQRAVRSADRLFVYSSAMAEEVDRVYGLEAGILPPPVTVDAAGPSQPLDIEPGFVLCPCRLMGYKNIDLVLEAFQLRPDDRLVVAGGGPEEARLRAVAPPNATLVGQVDDLTMRWLYTNCRMIVSAAFEPFGLVTLEANAFGRPAAVIRMGGFRDTVLEGATGQFFAALEPDEISAAVDEVDRGHYDDELMRRHAAQWSEEVFIERLRAIVAAEAGIG